MSLEINEIAPKHDRTSCIDDSLSSGNHYFNELGYPRCARCVLLYREKYGHWPHDAKVDYVSIKLEKT